MLSRICGFNLNVTIISLTFLIPSAKNRDVYSKCVSQGKKVYALKTKLIYYVHNITRTSVWRCELICFDNK